MLKERATANHLPLSADEIIRDYRLAYQSRQASIIGRREVFSGRAKFGDNLRRTIRRYINHKEYEAEPRA